MSGSKDWRQMIVRLENLPGWVCTRRRGNHYRVTGPGGALYFMAVTPSDTRALRNAVAALRRQGADL